MPKPPNTVLARPRLLIVDDDRDAADALAEALVPRGYEVRLAHLISEATDSVETFEPEIALIDIRLGREHGLDLVRELKRKRPQLPCIVMTAYDDLEVAIGAVRHGAYDFLRKPLSLDLLEATLQRCNELVRLQQEQELTETALRKSEGQLRTITDALPVLIAHIDTECRFRFVNNTIKDWYEKPIEEIIGKKISDVLGEEAFGMLRPYTDRVLAGESVTFEDAIKYPDGKTRNVQISYVPDFGETGAVHGFFGLIIDLTARKRMEEALRVSETRLSDAIESISEGFVLYDPDGRLVLCNEIFREFYPQIGDDLVPGLKFADLARKSFERGAVKTSLKNVEDWIDFRVSQYEIAQGTYEVELPDGRWLLCSERKTADGYTAGIRADITEIKRTGEQLRQAQKMEAVGQLTGGMAHDFNNLLGVIIGNLDFIDEEIDENSPLRTFIDAASTAALSGADLNRQLLAFSRQQSLSPRVIDLNDSVSAVLGMLQRTFGAMVEIEANRSDGLWAVEADPGQVEAALLNLAVNARDAMPEGGKLTIETANIRLNDVYAAAQVDVTPGEYVMLALTDTGEGMRPEILGRVFEPFFTTKEIGQGTGLGLSMVFGFAKQSGGHVTIYSELGKGTSVKLYLPRVWQEVGVAEQKIENIPMAEGETVLLVEDDPDLRTMVLTMLKDLGYQVLEAGNGESAMAAMAQTSRINLLLTDVVLPGGMSGPDIAEEANRRLPGINVLFMSGYPRNAITQQGYLKENVLLLEKPFRKAGFAKKLREALHSESR